MPAARIFYVWRCFPIANTGHQTNEEIRDKEVRLISESGEQLGIMSSQEALRLAEERSLDLVKIYPQKGSFVSKIDYDLIEESKFIRLSLELAALRLLCEQGIPADVLALFHKNLEAQRRYVQNPGVYNTMLELDNEFHRP